VRVVCGQCGQVLELDDGFDQPTVECTRCGHIITIPRADLEQAAEAAEGFEELDLEDDERGFAEQARSATERRIPITCPNCGKTVTVGARLAGRRARCKGCDHPLQIPYPDDLEEFKLPSFRRRVDESETGLELISETDAAGEPAGPPGADQAAAASANEALDWALEPPPQPAWTPELSESEEAGELVTAVEGYRGRRAGARRARRSSLVPWLIVLGAVVVVAAGVALVGPGFFAQDSNDPKLAGVDANDAPPTTRNAAQGSPTTKRIGPDHPTPVPKPDLPICKLLTAVLEPFANGGYFPARTNAVYCKITVLATAGRKPVRFRTYGQDVTLTTADRTYLSLGEPAGGGPVPVRSRRTTVSLPPGKGRKVTFLFELPQQDAVGRLTIANLAGANLALNAAPKPVPAAALNGTYSETVPRNLRPLLRDPVMAAIQAAPGRQLSVAATAKGLRLAMPDALISGLATEIAPGRFRATLHHGSNALDCTLRFLNGGRRLILYLADQPFHQLTYVNPGASAAPGSRPKPPASRPASRPATRPSPPKPVGSGPAARLNPNESPASTGPAKSPTRRSLFD
jgi:DNA-directed RNA polymerase subunit RPC12/RpoP